IVLFSENLLANDEPNKGTLFRVDTRNSTEIFSAGFSPFGNNDNIRDHSRGVSCIGRNENSAFISTTSSSEYAANYARRLVTLRNEPVYVYVFDSTASYYNMALSLTNMGYSAGVNDARTQSEWISYGAIPSSSIRGVRVYTGPETPAVIPNPNYIPRTPVINNQPYISEQQNSLPGIGGILANLSPLVGACMAATVSCFNPNGFKNRSSDSCGFIEPYRKNTILRYSTFIPLYEQH
ncbi:TPA: hypothetical protein ACPY8P_003960, partial [Yersinia enterocolitica]